jgi:hypothetical protein
VAPGAPLFVAGNTEGLVSVRDDAFVEARDESGKVTFYLSGTAKHVRAASAAGDHAFFASEFSGALDFAGVRARTADTAAFVARIEASGTFTWGRVLTTPSFTRVAGVAAAPDGGAVVALGVFARPKEGPLAVPLAGSSDAVLVRYDAAGQVAWVKTFGWPGYDEAAGVAVGADGDTTMAGTRWKSPDQWASALADGRCHGWVTRLDARGEPRWSIDLGADTTRVTVNRMAPGARGEVVVGGSVRWRNKVGSFDLDGGEKDKAYLAAIDRDGHVIWVRLRNTTGCIAVDTAGNVVSVSTEGIAVETPAGEATRVLAFEKDSVVEVSDCRLDGAGHLYVAGSARPKATIGGVPPSEVDHKRPQIAWISKYSEGFVAKIGL